MKKHIFIIVFITVIGCAYAQVETNIDSTRLPDLENDNSIPINDSTNMYQPRYMELPVLNNYLINQPIRETIRWVCTINGIIGTTTTIGMFFSKNPGLSIQDNAFNFQILVFGTIGAIIGLPTGIIKGIKYSNYPNKKVFKEPFCSTEWKIINEEYKTNISFFLHFENRFFLFNEFIFGSISTDWKTVSDGFEEKIFIGLADLYTYDNNFSFYYNLLGGYSKGYYDNPSHQKVTKENFVALGQIGLKLNLLDFCYFKLEAEQEYSPFYYHLKSVKEADDNLSQKANYNFGIVFGTEIF